MSAKIKNLFKTAVIILLVPVVIPIISYTLEFILQLGRITGTIVRIIMNL